ncbi:MAG: class I SAM-dependent methyltransferase [Nanoarchaeota archaeon]|nr:class I SAM-dependent methyltransferase [Nanoarchaeota archaeon]
MIRLNQKKINVDKLNLGCSVFKKKGFLNVDIDSDKNPDLLLNLDKIPYPFKDESFSLITADHVLEHLNNPFEIMKELYRILKPRGKLIIKVPHFSRGFTHPDHKRGFDVSFPLYFNEDFKAFYTGTSFKLEKLKLTWCAQPYLKKITLSPVQYFFASIIGNIIDLFANASPYLCSRLWCFWVGGFEEIEFIFIKQGVKAHT